MGFYNNLCPGCMNEVGDKEKCPYCGFDLTSEQVPPFLAYGTVLAGKYVIGDVLEQSSEGVTYLGLDTITNNCVRIREFLPSEICSREKDDTKLTESESSGGAYTLLKSEFLAMWHKLMKLKSLESMINILDVFEANNTAYAIAEADGSSTLSEYLEERGGILTWDEIKEKLFPVMDALEAMHRQGLVHGAISTDTLFLCGDGKFKPWGFGIAAVRKTEGVLSPDIRPGYAAVEQYGNQMTLSPATDVYGFGAVLYKCVTGSVAIDAEIRSKEDTLAIPAEYARELPDYVLAAFIGALQVLPGERTADIAALKNSFTREAFEKQRRRATALLSGEALVDPLSELAPEDEEVKPTGVKPVIVTPAASLPVVKKDTGTVDKTSTASTVILSFSIVFVMIIFFACLALTGIVSFNIGGTGTSASVVEVPDFTNYSKNDPYISQFAEKYGIHITLQPASSVTVAADVIYEQDVAAGTQIATGSDLTLIFSAGMSTVTLPNFTGMTITETVYYLGKLNLSYNITERENSGSSAAGTVASMSPASGTVVQEGSEITIEIWGDAPASSGGSSGDSGSDITSSSSILDSIIGSLSDSVSGLGSTIQNFFN